MSCLLEKFQDEMRHQKTSAKKALDCFWFLVGDFNISDIFYKIRILKKLPVFPIIPTELILSLIPMPFNHFISEYKVCMWYTDILKIYFLAQSKL